MATDILSIVELTEGQYAPYVTHNEALAKLEAVLVRVLSRTNGGPPASPANGDTYIVDSAAGDWSDASVDDIAHYVGGGWEFYTPIEGLKLWCNDENTCLVYDGSSWIDMLSWGDAGAYIYAKNATDVVITDTSKVGIATTTPQERLTLGSGSNFAVEMETPSNVAASVSASGTLDGTYYYKVSASDGVGWTTLSAEVSETVDGGTTNGTIEVSWDAVTGATKYRVWRGTAADSENEYYETTSTSLSDDGSLTFTADTAPTVTTSYVNKVTASGNSWFLGGNVGIGTNSPETALHVQNGEIKENNREVLRYNLLLS